MTTARHYFVFKADRAVLDLREGPGVIRSVAAPPPGWTPPSHPFVDASSLFPETEHRLRELLLASVSFDDLLAKLVADGFDLFPGDADRYGVDRPAERIEHDGKVVGARWRLDDGTTVEAHYEA
jgi:hypothetical protein